MNKIEEHILNYIMSQTWAIDLEFGLTQLNQFLFEQKMNSDWLKETMLERRKSLAPQLIYSNSELVFNSSLYSSDIKPNSILKLNVSGLMTVEDQMCSNNGIRRISNDLYAAYENKNIDGIVMEMKSGGGEEMAGVMLNSAIQDRNKPVIAFIHQSGSAALRGTLSTDERWASSESSQVGSIGVYLSIQKNFAEMYNSLIEDIYATQSPDKNKAFRALLAGDKGPLQLMVNDAAKIFQSEVKKSLPLKGDERLINETLSGGMFNASDAKRRGLIDGTSTLYHVVKRIKTYL